MGDVEEDLWIEVEGLEAVLVESYGVHAMRPAVNGRVVSQKAVHLGYARGQLITMRSLHRCEPLDDEAAEVLASVRAARRLLGEEP